MSESTLRPAQAIPWTPRQSSWLATLWKRRGVSRSGREHEARDHREKQSCFRHTFLLWLAAVFIDLTTHS